MVSRQGSFNKSGYSYGGLYQVVDFKDKMGKSGFKICQFTLKKIAPEGNLSSITEGMIVKLQTEGKEPKWFAIGVDAPNAQKISAESKMAQLLLNKEIGENIKFGPGFRVLGF